MLEFFLSLSLFSQTYMYRSGIMYKKVSEKITLIVFLIIKIHFKIYIGPLKFITNKSSFLEIKLNGL